MIESHYCTTREAAEQLGLALSTVRSMVSRGTLRTEPTRFGLLIPSAEIQRYKEESLKKPGRRPIR